MMRDMNTERKEDVVEVRREREGKGLIPSLTGHDTTPSECNETKSTPSSVPHTAPMPDLD